MKLPSLLRRIMDFTPTHEKKSETDLPRPASNDQTAQATLQPSYYKPLITKISYGFSVMLGVIGTYFTLRSQTVEDADMPGWVLYSFTLMSAGLFLESAKVSESTFSVPPPPHSPDKSSSRMTLELMPLKTRLSSIPRSESKTNPFSLDDSLAISREASWMPDNPDIIPPVEHTRGQRFLRTAIDLFSITWFVQVCSLFVRNAIHESSHSVLLPYTTLIGIATGQLCHIVLKPWRLGGFRDWLFANRNLLVGHEVIAFIFLPPVIGRDLSVYYFSLSAFWSGFNFNEGTFFITKKLFETDSKITTTDESTTNPDHHIEVLAVHRRMNLLTAAVGGLLTGTAITLLQLAPNDSNGFRNIFSGFLGAVGCYLLTYPLGNYLGHKIPSRYHDPVLEVCTYLLIPLASPDLSILHFLAMTGGGVCGGICHYIIQRRHQKILTVMRSRLTDIEKLMTAFPTLTQQLLALPLPKDQLLLGLRNKNLKIRIASRLTQLFLLFATVATQSLWKDYPINISLAIGAVLLPIIVDWVLPKYSPSIYDSHEISPLSRFFYLDSFSQTYITKVIVFICLQNSYDAQGHFLILQKNRPASVIFSANLQCLMFWFFSIKIGYKKFHGGYAPYFPSDREIMKLALIAQPEQPHQDNLINPLKPSIILNYHLLQFMKKNMPQNTENTENHLTPQEPLERKSNEPCRHPLEHLSLFAIRNHSTTQTKELSVIPLADVRCLNCQKDFMQINTEFSERSRKFMERCFDVTLETTFGNAVVRGNAIAHQFAFGLPPGLSLTTGVKSFTL